MPLNPPQAYRKTAYTHRRDTRANQPAATDVLAGTLYYVTDEFILERSNGAAWQSYSDTVYTPPTYTQGSVLFAGVTGAPTQDNSNLFWSDSNNRLGIGINAPLFALDVRGPGSDIGYIARFQENNTAGSTYVQISTPSGAANAQAGFSLSQIQNSAEWRFAVIGNDGNAFRISGGLAATNRLYVTVNGNICINDSNVDPGVGTKSLIFGDGTAPSSLDSNTAGLFAEDVGGTVNMFAINEAGNTSKLTGFTTGSIIFAVTATGFTESNSQFFWDNGNSRLGIGTATPAVKLHVNDGLFQIDVYGSTTAGIVTRSAGGTNGAPSQTAINTTIFSLAGRSYTDAGAYTGNVTAINGATVVAPTATDLETSLTFRVVPSGATAMSTIMQLFGEALVVNIGLITFVSRASAGSVALKRSSTVLQTRLGDDSAFAQHSALEFMSNRANFLMRTAVSWSNGAAAQTGTLTNAPAAGNPTKWIPVDDNGTTRYIPAW